MKAMEQFVQILVMILLLVHAVELSAVQRPAALAVVALTFVADFSDRVAVELEHRTDVAPQKRHAAVKDLGFVVLMTRNVALTPCLVRLVALQGLILAIPILDVFN